MSRLDGSDDPMPEGLWWSAYRRARTSKRGQRVLRDLEQALLAIPDKRLAYEHISHEGAVCAVGAYVTWKELQADPSKDRAAVVKDLEAAYYWESESLRGTAMVGREAGIAWTLAWEIGAANDYAFGKGFTPEERWEKMLAWVREQIIPVTASA
jgi:hypothetical protein